MGRRRERNKRLDPERVLSGQLRPSVTDLMALIHQVNPTGRDVPDDEAAERYDVKSKLQSLLLRQYPERVRVEPDASAEGLVVIHHRYGPENACHAVLAELDPDARSFVQLGLDTGRWEPAAPASSPAVPVTPASPSPAPVQGVEALLTEATEAETSYDFERARQVLTRAFQREPSRRTAGPLLRLLVDTLGMDPEAQAVAFDLAGDVSRDPELRALVATAFARSGDREAALQWLQGAEDVRAADAIAGMAGAAISRGNLSAARADLQALRQRDPTHPSVALLQSRLTEAAAVQRQPLEEAAEAAFVAERFEEAERLASELIEQWPDSALGRMILARLREDEKDESYQRHMNAAARYAARGKLSRAIAALRAAIDAGGEPSQIEPRITALMGEARERDEREQIAGLVADLQTDRPARALQSYSEWSSALRERARQQVPDPRLGWLEEAHVPARKSRIPAGVLAVLALDEARLRAEREPENALQLLEPHQKLLAPVAAYQQLVSAAQQALRERRQRETLSTLARAECALAAADLAAAREALDGVDAAVIPENAGRVTAARAALDRAERLRDLTQAYQDAAARDPFEALRVVDALLALGDDPDLWRARHEATVEQARQILSLTVVHAPASPPPVADGYYCSTAAPWLLDDGTAVLWEYAGGWILLAHQDPRTNEVLSVARLRCGHPDVAVANDRVAVADRERVVELALPGWRPLRCRKSGLDALQDAGEVVSLPGTDYVWALDERRERAHAVNLDTGARARTLDGVLHLNSVPGFGELRLACVSTRQELSLLAAGGKQLLRLYGVGDEALAIAPWAPHRHLVLSGATDAILAESDEGFQLRLHDGPPIEVPDTAAWRTVQLAARPENGTVYVLTSTDEFGNTLFVFDVVDRELRLQRRLRLPSNSFLLQDAGAKHLAVLEPQSDVPRLRRIDDLSSEPVPPPPPHPGALFDVYCLGQPAEHDRSHVLALGGTVRMLSPDPDQRREWVASFCERKAADLHELSCLYHARVHGDGFRWEDLVARALITHHPDAPLSRILRANEALEARDFAQIVELIGPVVRSERPETLPEHAWHLLALARLYQGDPAAARATLDEAPSSDGCPLLPLRRLCELLEAPPGDALTGLRGILERVRRADERFAAGDTLGARDLLDHGCVLRSRECQSLARLAHAWFETPPGTPEQQLRMHYTLMQLVRLHQLAPNAPPLPLIADVWPRERIRILAERAREWLRADGR